jgi:serine/threonine protein kinase/Flp pilus assembly protein TadD
VVLDHNGDFFVMDETRWGRLSDLFERLLTSDDVATLLGAEPDPEIRRAAEELWKHHLQASREQFLNRSLQFEVMPMFRKGQVLADRFRIERMLGSGGMGEVYLATDLRIEELVALKTVARLLTHVPEVRRRIAAEVQSARRVTHPNVCRIHDLFEDGETIFFSMEYVEGRLLSEIPDDRATVRYYRQLVRQMAEGLEAAHRKGVVHGDFKPANVMVAGGSTPRAVIMDFGLARALDGAGASADASMPAGTAKYMAPELLSGARPSIRTDVYAFGVMAHQLLPGERLWDECTKARPEDRPDSLAVVIRRLQPSTTRRLWLLGSAAAAGGAFGYSFWSRTEGTAAAVPAGARVLVNGFHSEHPVAGTRVVRALMLTALKQSPRFHAIDDQDLLPALRHLQLAGGALPLAGANLQKLLTSLRAAFWIDADLNQQGSRYALNLRLSRAADGRTVIEKAIRDRPGLTDLAQVAALWLRMAAGESERSLVINPVMVGAYTSKVPEALEKYYDAMELYAVARMAEAIPLLEEAVRLDPNFAQAHSMLGMCLNSSWQYERAFPEVSRASDLAQDSRFPERERAWIQANYYTLSEDPANMVAAAIRNTDYFPDEPRYHRVLGHILCRTGRAADAVGHNRTAVELAPNDDLLRSSLMDSLCQAGRFQEALGEFQTAKSRGGKNAWLENGAGLAYLGLERYREARDAYEQEPDDPTKGLDVLRPSILDGDLERAIAGAREVRAGARGPIDAHMANEFLCGLYGITDRPALALNPLREMAGLPAYPPMARRLDCAAFWAYRLGADDVLAEVHARLAQIRSGWDNDFTRTVERHAASLESRRAGHIERAETELLDASDLGLSVWRLFDAAEFYAATGRPDRAEDYWRQLEERRGTILELWFPGVLPMAWLGRAASALARKDATMAHKYAQKVVDHWARENSQLKIVQAALKIAAASRTF